MVRPTPVPDGQRLDQWLWFGATDQISHACQALIERGKVRVNKLKADRASHWREVGDTITFFEWTAGAGADRQRHRQAAGTCHRGAGASWNSAPRGGTDQINGQRRTQQRRPLMQATMAGMMRVPVAQPNANGARQSA